MPASKALARSGDYRVVSVPAHEAEAAPASPLPLVWVAALRDASGYADEARTFVLAAEREGVPLIARDIAFAAQLPTLPGAHEEALAKALARPLPHERVTAWHIVPAPGQPRDESVNVVRSMFETDRMPRSWLSRLLSVDEVWVPCAFNVETFARSGVPVDRLHVLPETIDFDLFDPALFAAPQEPRPFTFLANFDFTDRKGWDILLDAWADAFAPDDDVRLLLKCLGLNTGGEELVRERIEAYLAGRDTAEIVLNLELLPAAEMPRLYRAADAFVLPSRGEGWGRPYMEAMAMGLPTIGSAWSGNLEFMDPGNSWLVEGRVVEVAEGAQAHTPLYRGHRWFEPDREALAAAMRELAAGGDLVARRAARARAELIERFGPEPTAARLAELTEGALERARLRRSRPVACVWRGDWGSVHSLAVVNDATVGAIEAGGPVVHRIPPETQHVESPAVGVAQQWPPEFRAPTDGPFVLFQPWEFGTVPAAWVDLIRERVDEVWTPSEAARRMYVDSGVHPDLVRVVPNGVDLERFSPDGPARPRPTAKTMLFLFVGGTTHRKGIDVLLEAWGRAFTAADDVCLAVKAFGDATLYRGQRPEEAFERLRSRPDAPELVLLDEELPFDELPALYRSADVLVQPYRGEGFCLPALEALACGVPTIVTAGGPTDDFASDACAWRIPARRVPLAADALGSDELRLAREGHLLEPDVDALVAALREAAAPAARDAKAAEARAHAERFSWSAAGSAARTRLDELAGTTPIRRVAPQRLDDARPILLVAPGDWPAALDAYVDAFAPDDPVTLALPGVGEDEALAVLAGRDVADVALVPAVADSTPLALGADAVVGVDHPRARRSVPADPAALRALLPC